MKYYYEVILNVKEKNSNKLSDPAAMVRQGITGSGMGVPRPIATMIRIAAIAGK
jgi:hypothetical protein